MLNSPIFFIVILKIVFAQETWEAKFDNFYKNYEQYDDLDNWRDFDDNIEAKEEEYDRYRRQTWVNRFRLENERDIMSESDPELGNCPLKCTCRLPHEVHCTFKFLTDLPEETPTGIQKLNLGYNRITRILPSSLNKFSDTLRLLYLHSNDIESLDNGLFSKNNKIEVLRLSWNRLSGIRKNAFQGLSNLHRLYLDNNHITFIHPLAFRGLVNLKLIQLDGNRLSRLHSDVFVTVEFHKYFRYSSIEYLYLAKNNFTLLPRHLFDHMSELRSVYLHRNKWDCTCETRWMKIWMVEENKYKCKRNTWKTDVPVECAMCNSPTNLNGQKLQDLRADNFTCTHPHLTYGSDKDQAFGNGLNAYEIDQQNENILFRHSGFYSTPLNVRLDSHKRSVFHAKCDLADFPIVTVKETKSGNMNSTSTHSPGKTLKKIYLATFNVTLRCVVEYPENFAVLRTILNPYINKDMKLNQRQKKHRKTAVNQRAYSISVTNMSKIPTIPLTTASMSSSTEFIKSPSSTITFLSKDIDFQNRTINLQYYTSFNYVYKTSKLAWVLIKQPNPMSVEPRIILQNQKVTLRCKILGHPKPKIAWILPNGLIMYPKDNTGNIAITKSGRIILHRPQLIDAGYYRCITISTKLVYEHAAANEIATLKVYVLPTTNGNIIQNFERLKIQTVERGGNWSFRYPIKSVPDSKYAWITPTNQMIVGKTIGRRGRTTIDNTGKIEIHKFRQSDQGLYRFIAANIVGTTEYSVYVGVKNMDYEFIKTEQIQFDIDEKSSTERNMSSIINSKISQRLSKFVVANEGDRVELDCDDAWVHSPKYTWHFPETLANTTIERKIQLVDAKLILQNVTIDFQGAYACAAQNESHRLELTVNLTVHGKRAGVDSRNTTDADEFKNDFKPANHGILPSPDYSFTVTSVGSTTSTLNVTRHVDTVITNTLPDVEPSIIIPELTSPKSSHFLDTPADYKPHPVIVTARNRTHRTKSPKLLDIIGSTHQEFDLFEASDNIKNDREKFQQNIIIPDNANKKEEILKLNNDDTTTNIIGIELQNINIRNITTLETVTEADSIALPEVESNITENIFISLRSEEVDENFDIPKENFKSSSNDHSSIPHQNNLDQILPPKQSNSDKSQQSIDQYRIDIKNTSVIDHASSPSPSHLSYVSNQDNGRRREPFTGSTKHASRRYKTESTKSSNKRTYAASYVNKTVSTRKVTSENAQVEDFSMDPGKNTSDTMQMQTPVLLSSAKTEEATFETPMSRDSILYTFSSEVQAEYGLNTVLPCLPPDHNEMLSSLWTFKWTLPSGKRLTRPHKIFSSDLRQFIHMNGSLILRTLDSKDEGFYECSGTEMADNVEYLSYVTLNLSAHAPKLLGKSYQNIDVNYKKSVMIQCSATGKPKPEISWETPSGHILHERERHGRIHVRRGGSLSISQTRPEESGIYKCKATNKAGTRTKIVRLQVTTYPPVILGQKRRTMRVRNGGNIKLSCIARGQPRPTFKWILPNNKPLRSNQAIFRGSSRRAKYFVANNGTLLLTYANYDDTGRYICIATNKLGRDVSTTNLVIHR